MSVTERQEERRARDRSQGIVLRRRRNSLADPQAERRQGKKPSGFDIAGALELHLDEVTTRRSMIALLESWLLEAKSGDPTQQDADYVRAVERGIEVMRSAPDPLTAIAILQRQ